MVVGERGGIGGVGGWWWRERVEEAMMEAALDHVG